MTLATVQDVSRLLREGRAEEALESAAALLGSETDAPALIDLAARAALKLGRRDEALELLERQRRLFIRIKVRPRAYYKLGMQFRAAGALEQAEEALARAADMRRDIPIPAIAHAQVLLELGRERQAAEVATGVINTVNEDATALGEIAVVLHRSGRLGQACGIYRRATMLAPDRDFLFHNWCLALMTLGETTQAAEISARWLARKPGNIRALAFRALSLWECEDPAAGFLLDFDRFVRTSRIAVPDGYQTLAEFNAALESSVLNHPTLATPDDSHPTYHDPHLKITEEILGEQRGPVADLEAVIQDHVDAYFSFLGEDRRHPFVKYRPRSYRLSGWAAVLDRQGAQHQHIHEDGYLSGCYYIRIPDEVRNQQAGEGATVAGGLEVGRPPDELNCKRQPSVRTIRPEPGLMVLFPAYMFHRTIPFQSEEQRICIAFDVLPES